MSNTYYITTPIYYTNGEPHLGHVYCTVCTDVLARFHRLCGEDVHFVTGTDEHGVKMVKTAAALNTEPAALAEKNAMVFREVWKEMGIINDDFIRTTEPRHKLSVQEIIRRMVANDDIYLSSYEGWYDEGQEEFVTETEAKANEYKSAISGRPLLRYKEQSYFFRLSKYVPQVLKHIEDHPDFVQPQSRRNEVISKIKAGVDDLSISRATLKWGIPLPNDPEHVVYVWIDALSNYITALGYGSKDQTLYRKYWPGVHIIGKEILWFHCVYWPAMLLSLGEPLPRGIFAHGWWTSEGKKMSKSMGNFVDLERLRAIAKAYSNDALRYYMVRAGSFGSDLDWTESDFIKSFNELANVLGNGLNRTIKMIGKYRDGKIPPVQAALEPIDRALVEKVDALADAVRGAYLRYDLQAAATLPLELARLTNGYIESTEPFKLAKDPAKAQRLSTVLGLAAEAIAKALVALIPVLPEKAIEGLKQLNIDFSGKSFDELMNAKLPAGHQLGDGKPLFPKVEPKKD